MSRVIQNFKNVREGEKIKTCPHCEASIAYRYQDMIPDLFHELNPMMVICPNCKKTFYTDSYKSTETM